MENLFLLKGKNVIVTGGSRGIGRAVALRFAEMGANIAILYAGNEEAASAVLGMLTEKGVKAGTYRCNVAKYEEAEETVQKIIKDFGGIDVLVNNAGITKDNLIMKMSEDDFDAVIATNLKGA
ncbi:MAG TPA: beta-ketoacyl-ACP reductase, partial [Clostridiales bacterium]|nr:beta-ketoacyl-ACP reductase [Clostridiales bacterium]